MGIDKIPILKVTAYWGNDDVSCTIRVRKSIWRKVEMGSYYKRIGYYGYEGEDFRWKWIFSGGLLSISGAEGGDHLLGLPLEELIVVEEKD
jgi:hypothetical protein